MKILDGCVAGQQRRAFPGSVAVENIESADRCLVFYCLRRHLRGFAAGKGLRHD